MGDGLAHGLAAEDEGFDAEIIGVFREVDGEAAVEGEAVEQDGFLREVGEGCVFGDGDLGVDLGGRAEGAVDALRRGGGDGGLGVGFAGDLGFEVIAAGDAAGDIHENGIAGAGCDRTGEAGFQAAFLVEIFDFGGRALGAEGECEASAGALRRRGESFARGDEIHGGMIAAGGFGAMGRMTGVCDTWHKLGLLRVITLC